MLTNIGVKVWGAFVFNFAIEVEIALGGEVVLAFWIPD
jgi:hypothetical protein